MGTKTEISWTDATFNPWWGCAKVSEACDNCYAERWAKRTGWAVFGPTSTRRLFGDHHWNDPLRWNRQAQKDGLRVKVFCGSMCDVFEDRKDLMTERSRLCELIEQTAYLDWLLLTKRPQNALDLVPPRWNLVWPQNIWFGITAENQARLEERWRYAARIPVKIKFVSIEPIIGPVNLHLATACDCYCNEYQNAECPGTNGLCIMQRKLDWVIVGGETGPGARPCHPDWVRSLRDQCQAAGVAFHLKQMGEWTHIYNSKSAEAKQRIQLTVNGTDGSDLHNSDNGGDVWMYRVGKKAAGRMLDGKEWLEFPEAK